MDARFHHVAISVRDIERTMTFYRDILGFEVDWDMDHRSGETLSRVVGLAEADMRIIMLKGYGLRLELFKYYNPEGRETGSKKQCDFGITHFALFVKNINEVYERLINSGVKFNCPPQNTRPGVWVTYMKDPEGITIELIEHLQE